MILTIVLIIIIIILSLLYSVQSSKVTQYEIAFSETKWK